MGSAWLTVEIRTSMDGRRLERFLRARVAVVAASNPRAARWWCARPAWPRPAPAGLGALQASRSPGRAPATTLRVHDATAGANLSTARQPETEGGRDADERSGRRQDRRRVRKSLAAEPGRSDRGGARTKILRASASAGRTGTPASSRHLPASRASFLRRPEPSQAGGTGGKESPA